MPDETRYQRFIAHQNNVNEIIEASDINLIQTTLESTQVKIFNSSDQTFYEKSLFILDNHTILNSLYIDIFENTSKLDLIRSTNLTFSEAEKAIVISDSNVETIVYSKFFQNQSGGNIKDVMITAQIYKPSASVIEFEISNNQINYYPIDLEKIFTIPTSGTGFTVRIRMTKTYNGESPVVYGFSVLYKDPKYIVDLKSVITLDENDIYKLTSHKDLVDITPDDHHPMAHSHNGLDGSGLVNHNDLVNIGEDDHHPKNHQHGVDGVSKINLETDVQGTLAIEYISPFVSIGKAGITTLIYNPLMEDKLVKISGPDEIVYLQYDWANEGRLNKIYTLKNDFLILEQLAYSDGLLTGTSKQLLQYTQEDLDELNTYTTSNKS